MSEIPLWLKRDLKAIERLEAARARDRQAKARTGQPVNLGFGSDLAPELRQAVDRLWAAAHSSDPIRADPVLGKLWQDVNRGYSTLSEPDFLEFTTLPPEQMRAIGRWLIEGQSLKQAAWLARQQQKDPQ